jgi:MerR family transcriptional regulator, copper efflux regulator
VQIGELAKLAGVTVQTVRFYERSKLLPEPKRKNSGYRIYSQPDLKRLLFVLQAKSLGFSLDEIRDILRLRERGNCPCGEVISVAERHLRDVERQLRQLTTFRDGLRTAIRDWKKSGDQTPSADVICALIERAAQPSKPNRNTATKRLTL